MSVRAPEEPLVSEERRRLAAAGVALALLAVILQTALYLVDVYALDRRVGTLDVDGEHGFPAWAATVATFSTGFVALLLSFVDHSRRMHLLALAAAATFLSLDEALILHERLGLEVTDALDLSDKYLRVAWPVAYLPLLVVVALLIVRLAQASADPARRLLAGGLVVLAGAVGLEIAGLALDLIPGLTETGWLYTVQIALEEAAELAGWILLTTGLAVLLLDRSADRLPARRQP